MSRIAAKARTGDPAASGQLAPTLKMKLLDNSLDFLREALHRAVEARKDPAHWKFAVLCFCQATELAVKARLQREHPALVFANLDKHTPQPRTVTLEVAVIRLTEWCGVSPTPADRAAIKRVSTWRNCISHWEFDIDPKLLKVQLAALLVFLDSFFRLQLHESLSRRLGPGLWQDVVKLESFANRLSAASLRRVATEAKGKLITTCGQCGNKTCVIDDDIYECFLCGDSGGTFICPKCREAKPLYKRWEGDAGGWCEDCVEPELYADLEDDA